MLAGGIAMILLSSLRSRVAEALHRALDLGTGVPLLVYVRTTYTRDRPVRLTETIFRGDRNRLVYELGQLDALDPHSE